VLRGIKKKPWMMEEKEHDKNYYEWLQWRNGTHDF
jgi:hypothetical protein